MSQPSAQKVFVVNGGTLVIFLVFGQYEVRGVS